MRFVFFLLVFAFLFQPAICLSDLPQVVPIYEHREPLEDIYAFFQGKEYEILARYFCFRTGEGAHSWLYRIYLPLSRRGDFPTETNVGIYRGNGEKPITKVKDLGPILDSIPDSINLDDHKSWPSVDGGGWLSPNSDYCVQVMVEGFTNPEQSIYWHADSWLQDSPYVSGIWDIITWWWTPYAGTVYGFVIEGFRASILDIPKYRGAFQSTLNLLLLGPETSVTAPAAVEPAEE